MYKKAAIFTFVLACLVSPIAAQQQPKTRPSAQPRPQPRPQREPTPRPEPRRERQVQINRPNSDAAIERLRKSFRLTDSQVFQLRPMVYERDRQMVEMQEQERNAQARKSLGQSIQDQFQREFRTILTPTQAEQLDFEAVRRPGKLR
jgi:hypothetical protein